MATNWEYCEFDEKCMFMNKNGTCGILREMPKPRKDGRCPFGKELPGDIGGETPYRDSNVKQIVKAEGEI